VIILSIYFEIFYLSFIHILSRKMKCYPNRFTAHLGVHTNGHSMTKSKLKDILMKLASLSNTVGAYQKKHLSHI